MISNYSFSMFLKDSVFDIVKVIFSDPTYLFYKMIKKTCNFNIEPIDKLSSLSFTKVSFNYQDDNDEKFINPPTSITNFIPLPMELSVIAGSIGYIAIPLIGWPFGIITTIYSTSCLKSWCYDSRASKISSKNKAVLNKKITKIQNENFKELKKLCCVLRRSILGLSCILATVTIFQINKDKCFTPERELIKDQKIFCNDIEMFFIYSIIGSINSIFSTIIAINK